MYKIAIVGFGSLGYRYFEAINRIRLPNIKLYIIDKKIKSIMKKHNLIRNYIKTSKDLNSFPKKVDLCIISTTCQNRHILLKKIINISNFKNLILEKPLTQSPKELLKLNNVLRKIHNVWVNTDRRCEDIYKFVKSKINIKNKISMRVEGNSWGICCNSLHYVDLFNFLSGQSLQLVKEKSFLRWFPSKRSGFQELDDVKLNLKFGKHELHLLSKKNSLPKNLKIFIKNKKKIFNIREKVNIFELRYNKKTFFFKNDPLSIKMTKTIKKILLTNKSNLPNYLNSTKLYYPLIDFFLEKWRIKFPKSLKVPIT
jgi:hypothetical protein|tara:strand:+ start:1010 stop:1945 length:936 start_codon:yes stop_codon:yes gene_type:complete